MFSLKFNSINSSDMRRLDILISNPNNFEQNLLSTKKLYLDSRKQIGDQTIQFREKILRLASFALTVDLSADSILAQYYAWTILNLQQVFLLFSNNKVREVFGNKLGSPLVVTHEDYFHCPTNLVFTQQLWFALKLQSEINSNTILSSINPTLKTGMKTELGNLRITLQQTPLTTDSPSFLIRRLPNSPISLDQLIAQDQISSVYAELLIASLYERKNIIIAGEPGSGKTTLANALLLESDPLWRTIIIEDASEIILPKQKFPFLQHYTVPSLDHSSAKLIREVEITKLLHRSPDYVFLGEIQTKLDTKSIFEAFSAGIRGMATTHARNFSSLLKRWTESHAVNRELIDCIDIIVITSREFSKDAVHMRVSDVFINKGDQFERIFNSEIFLQE